MRRSLFAHIYPSYIAIIAVAVVATALIAHSVLPSFLYAYTESELLDVIVITERVFFPSAAPVPAPGTQADWEERVDAYFGDRPFRVTLIALDGTVLADSRAVAANLENHADRPEFRTALEAPQGSSVRHSDSVDADLFYLARRVVRNGVPVAVVRASMPTGLIQEQLSELYSRIALGSVFTLIGAAFVAWAVVRRIGRPIAALVRSADRFGRGELEHRSYVGEPEELGTLADTMNAMAAELRVRIDDATQRRLEAEAILGGMSEGVIVLNRDYIVTQANQAAGEIFAVSGTAAPIGQYLLEAFRATDLKRYAEHVFSRGESVEGTLTLWNRGTRTLQVYASPVPDLDRCILVVHDISRLMHLETVRRDFVANVSHELRTPVTSIKGFVETLQSGALADPDRAPRYLGIIAKNADRLEQIITDLLSLARLEQQEGASLETQIAPVAEMLKNARLMCSLAAEAKNIAIDIDCPADLCCRANTSVLEQAFVNLVDNAVKYSGSDTRVRLTGAEAGDEVVVKVIDEGRGIPARDLPRIFERFYRVDKARSREAGGTGLGLAIVKHVVALHGGTVAVESRDGLGSTFSVSLPTVRGRAANP